MLQDVLAQVRAGRDFDQALAQYPRVFNGTYIGVVRAGMQSIYNGVQLAVNQMNAQHAARLGAVRIVMVKGNHHLRPDRRLARLRGGNAPEALGFRPSANSRSRPFTGTAPHTRSPRAGSAYWLPGWASNSSGRPMPSQKFFQNSRSLAMKIT